MDLRPYNRDLLDMTRAHIETQRRTGGSRGSITHPQNMPLSTHSFPWLIQMRASQHHTWQPYRAMKSLEAAVMIEKVLRGGARSGFVTRIIAR